VQSGQTGFIMIAVKVKGVGLDPSQNPLLLLIDHDETMVLPIGIGLSEAQAISLKLEGHKLPRPLTHDLIISVCGNLGGSIEKIVVTDIRDGTYYAEIYLNQNGQEIIVDSRPSDGIALALASGSPLFITDKVAENTLPFEEMVKENLQNIFDSKGESEGTGESECTGEGFEDDEINGEEKDFH